MKKMGMQQEEIEAEEVIIKTKDKKIVFKNPQVAKVTMMGQDSFQISGEFNEQDISSEVEINNDDISTVMDQTGCSEKKAEELLKKNNGDLAKTIMELQEE